jgi:hypothetical protein
MICSFYLLRIDKTFGLVRFAHTLKNLSGLKNLPDIGITHALVACQIQFHAAAAL